MLPARRLNYLVARPACRAALSAIRGTSRQTSSSPPEAHITGTETEVEANDEDEDDDDAIPRTPTWSVHALISSYPRPALSSATLARLHALAALVPPAAGSPAHARMKRELGELVRLVEAVRLVDTQGAVTGAKDDGAGEGEGAGAVPDGRIWPEGEGMVLSTNTRAKEFDDDAVGSGTRLLQHAELTEGGLYVVEADRRRK